MPSSYYSKGMPFLHVRAWIATGALSLLFLTACANPNITADLNTTVVTFPNGTKITAEVKRQDFDLLRGMMYRESLAQDRGMLFAHPAEDTFRYWMYQTKIPLDIIWMSRDRRIVEISPDTPPCTAEKASACPNYGGNQKSQYVLEVNSGVVARNGLKVGDYLDF